MITKVKILQHNRLNENANGFVSAKTLKPKQQIAVIFLRGPIKKLWTETF